MTAPSRINWKGGWRYKCAAPCGLRIRGHVRCKDCKILVGPAGHLETTLQNGVCSACLAWQAWRVQRRRLVSV